MTQAFSVIVFVTLATDHGSSNMPQQRFDIGVYYNLLYHLRKIAIF